MKQPSENKTDLKPKTLPTSYEKYCWLCEKKQIEDEK